MYLSEAHAGVCTAPEGGGLYSRSGSCPRGGAASPAWEGLGTMAPSPSRSDSLSAVVPVVGGHVGKRWPAFSSAAREGAAGVE